MKIIFFRVFLENEKIYLVSVYGNVCVSESTIVTKLVDGFLRNLADKFSTNILVYVCNGRNCLNC